MQPAECVLLFLVLAGNSALFRFLRSYTLLRTLVALSYVLLCLPCISQSCSFSYHVQGSFPVQTAWLPQACAAPTLSHSPPTLRPTIKMNWGYQSVLCIVACHQGFT